MLQKRIFGGAALAAALLSAGAANAALTTFDNQAAFSLAAGLTEVETFDAVVGEPHFRDAPLVVGDLTLLGYGGTGQLGRNFVDQPPALASSVNGTPQLTVIVSREAGFEITFASPMTAFGASFSNMNDVIQSARLTANGETVSAPVAPLGVRFFGFVSDTPFTTVRFSGGANDAFAMDDVRYAAAAPEPATWVLLIGGFGLAGLALRRRAVTAA